MGHEENSYDDGPRSTISHTIWKGTVWPPGRSDPPGRSPIYGAEPRGRAQRLAAPHPESTGERRTSERVRIYQAEKTGRTVSGSLMNKERKHNEAQNEPFSVGYDSEPRMPLVPTAEYQH